MRVYPELTVDAEFQSLGDLGYTGALNDRQYSFLSAQGLLGGLADMMYSWRNNPFVGFAVNSLVPTLVADMTNDRYTSDGLTASTFDDIFTHSRLGNATMVDSDGLLKWAPHNFIASSDDLTSVWDQYSSTALSATELQESSVTQVHMVKQESVTTQGGRYVLECEVAPGTGDRDCLMRVYNEGSSAGYVALHLDTGALGNYGGSILVGTPTVVALSDGFYRLTMTVDTVDAAGFALTMLPNTDTDTAVDMQSYTGDGTSTIHIRRASMRRVDLGGMADVPLDARVNDNPQYVQTSSTAKYLPRRHNHVYNGSAWVDAGTLIETEARTQLLHTTDALVTQSVTTTAEAHTLHFTGTGTVTLSGTSTAGPLVGTGTGEESRVSLTFTPTAGTLTLTVSGTVTDAQLEVGSIPSSYIPNLAASGTVARAADTSGLTIPSSVAPWPTPRVIGGESLTGSWATPTSYDNVTSGSGTSVVVTGGTTASRSYLEIDGVDAGEVFQMALTLNSISSGTLTAYFRDGTNPSAGTIVKTISGISAGDTITAVGTALSSNMLVLLVGGTGVDFDATVSVKEIDPLVVAIQVSGRMTYADENDFRQVSFARWSSASTNEIENRLTTAGSFVGAMQFLHDAGTEILPPILDQYSPGIGVPFNIASYHGSTFVNGAVGGAALTADTTPTALPDLSSTDLSVGYDFMGNIEQVRIWVGGITDVTSGNLLISEASS